MKSYDMMYLKGRRTWLLGIVLLIGTEQDYGRGFARKDGFTVNMMCSAQTDTI